VNEAYTKLRAEGRYANLTNQKKQGLPKGETLGMAPTRPAIDSYLCYYYI